MDSLNQEYSQLSKSLSKNIDKKEAQKDGIFFTPPSIIKKNNKILKKIKLKFKNVLEPSCGSCEYIKNLNLNFKDNNLNIDAIEFNKTIYDEIKDLNYENCNVNFIYQDYLLFNPNKKYDLVIGNPPFYVMKKKDVPDEFHGFFEGRPNIFILFIIKSLQLLEKDGILSFILPINFINCLYYNKIREYIYKYYKIIDIEFCKEDKYLTTQQDTIIFVVQNKSSNIENNNKKFTLKKQNYTIFNTKDNIKKIKKIYENSTTLSQLNYNVYVGNVVWNQCKELLTNDESETLLIYSSSIKDNQVLPKQYKNELKKNYIKKEGINEDVMLVLNRGYGKGDYKFDYCLIDIDRPYLIENHLICIKHNEYKNSEKAIFIEKYKKVIESITSNKTKEFIKLYFGNNALNTTELKYILPIYL